MADGAGWLDNHPGGSEVVLLMAGRDATDAFASYHPFTDKPRKVRGADDEIMTSALKRNPWSSDRGRFVEVLGALLQVLRLAASPQDLLKCGTGVSRWRTSKLFTRCGKIVFMLAYSEYYGRQSLARAAELRLETSVSFCVA